MDLFTRYQWPGNIRELANIVERLAILHPGEQVDAGRVREVLGLDERFGSDTGRTATPARQQAPLIGTLLSIGDPDAALTDRLDDYERALIRHALSMASGSVAEAARKLRTDRPNLYRRMRRLGIGAASTERGEEG